MVGLCQQFGLLRCNLCKNGVWTHVGDDFSPRDCNLDGAAPNGGILNFHQKLDWVHLLAMQTKALESIWLEPRICIDAASYAEQTEGETWSFPLTGTW